MTIAELLAKDVSPPVGYDPYYFTAVKPDGTYQNLCRGSFIFEKEYDMMLSTFPGILDWEVTAEYLPESDNLTTAHR
jgi:hypothetical protein